MEIGSTMYLIYIGQTYRKVGTQSLGSKSVYRYDSRLQIHSNYFVNLQLKGAQMFILWINLECQKFIILTI
jgi:hypothetical protein